VLTSESEYLSFISFSNLSKSLFIFSQFALEYLNIFLGFGWHLLKEVIMVWAELTISNARKCQIRAYYRPHPDDDISLEPLSQSLSRISPSSKSVIIVGGDFNLGHMDYTFYINNVMVSNGRQCFYFIYCCWIIC
jgi:hypothetical protein